MREIRDPTTRRSRGRKHFPFAMTVTMTVSFLFMLNLSKQNTHREGGGARGGGERETNELCHHWQTTWAISVEVAATVPVPLPSPSCSHYRSLRLLNCCHLSIAIHQFIKRLHSQFNDRPGLRTDAPQAAQTMLRARLEPSTRPTPSSRPNPCSIPGTESTETTLSSECSQRFLQIIIIILLYRHEVVCIYQKRRVQVESFGWGEYEEYGARLMPVKCIA